MKAFKYLLAGVMLFGAMTTASAQQVDVNAIAANAAQIIKANGPDLKKQVNQLYKDNKKNPAALVAIGREFYKAKSYDYAEQFADYAIARDNNCSPAFLLKGDICASKDDGGGAAENYAQAKRANPKDPEAYYRYAMVQRGTSPEEAVRNLEELRAQRPDYPVDALAGRIYYKSGKMEKAVEYYEKVPDVSKMEDAEITRFAAAEFLLGNYDKSIEVAKVGLQKNPRSAGWNRIVFKAYTEKKDTKNALAYADRLFHQSDSARISADDYAYYGTALQQNKSWDEALTAYKNALNSLETDTVQNIVTKGLLLQKLSDVSLEKGDYDQAVQYMELGLQEKAKPTSADYDNLARLYADIASRKDAANDKAGAAAAYKKADETFGKMMEAYPVQATYCNYMRAAMNSSLDPDSKKGLAKPYYEALITALEAKTDRTKGDNAMLGVAYQYIMVYDFNVKNDRQGAKEVAEKLLSVDPENEVAKQVMQIVK